MGVLTLDYMMKFPPHRHRESSLEWYANGGMSVLGGHLCYTLPDGERSTRYFDMIVDSDGKQDAKTSCALLEALLHHVATDYPYVKDVVIVSDNGGHFASFDFLVYINKLNTDFVTKETDLHVSEYVFTEPQWGKGKLDCHFAYLKLRLRKRVNEGQDAITPHQMYTLLTDSDGPMKNTTVLFIKPEAITGITPSTAITGIRGVGRVQFQRAGGDFSVYPLAGITAKKKTISLTDETRALGKWYKTYPSPSGTRYAECKSAKEVAHAGAAKQKRKKAAKKLTTREEVLVAGCEEFRESVVKRDVDVPGAVSPAVAQVQGVQMTIPYAKGDKMLAGADSDFGLVGGYGRRKNAAAVVISRAATEALRGMYERGNVPGAANKSAATTLEELQESVIKREWVDRVAMTETVIKKRYSEWYKRDKGLAAKEKAAKGIAKPSGWDKKKGGGKGKKKKSGEEGEEKQRGDIEEQENIGVAGEKKSEEVGEGGSKECPPEEAPDVKAEREEQGLISIHALEQHSQSIQAAEILGKIDLELHQSSML